MERLIATWSAIEMSITMVRNGAGPGSPQGSELGKEPKVMVAGMLRRTSPPAKEAIKVSRMAYVGNLETSKPDCRRLLPSN